MKCGLALLQSTKEDQPEVRAVCYSLFGTLAKVSINHLTPHMDLVMQYILKSLDNSLIVDNGVNMQVLIKQHCFKLLIFKNVFKISEKKRFCV